MNERSATPKDSLGRAEMHSSGARMRFSRKEKTMEDVSVIIQAISTVGFPIVMCGIMFWF